MIELRPSVCSSAAMACSPVSGVKDASPGPGAVLGLCVAVNIQPLQIGPVRLANNLLLAPIAGYCGVSFRLVARSCGGVGLACTDLLSPEGILRATPHTMSLAQTCAEDNPLCIQLYGADP